MKKQILLVDDDLNFRRSLLIQLELAGYQVKEAENVIQALSFLEQSKEKDAYPDLIITDIRMLGVQGLQFARDLRETWPQIPVLVISAFDPPDEVEDFPFLRKPFKMKELMAKLETL